MEQAMSGHLMVGCEKYDLLPENRGGIKPAISTFPVIPDHDAKTSQDIHSVQVQDPATPRDWHPQQPSPDQCLGTGGGEQLSPATCSTQEGQWSIVFEQDPGLADILTEKGHRGGRFNHRAVNTGHTNQISSMIKKGTTYASLCRNSHFPAFTHLTTKCTHTGKSDELGTNMQRQQCAIHPLWVQRKSMGRNSAERCGRTCNLETLSAQAMRA